MSKLRHLLFFCFLFLTFYGLAQIPVSVPFNQGFIARQKTNLNSVDAYKIYSNPDLNIRKTFFVQYVNSGNIFTAQGNDIIGFCRLEFLNGNALGTVSGSSSITLAQNQLPNVTWTGSIIDVAHGAVIAASASGVFTRAYGSSWGNAGGGGGTETFNLSIPLNGGVTQQSINITPKSLSVNTFIYLGY